MVLWLLEILIDWLLTTDPARWHGGAISHAPTSVADVFPSTDSSNVTHKGSEKSPPNPYDRSQGGVFTMFYEGISRWFLTADERTEKSIVKLSDNAEELKHNRKGDERNKFVSSSISGAKREQAVL